MSFDTFQKVAAILESDRTDNTYKYALLRAISEICQKYSHLKECKGDEVIFPIGLIVEKWLWYYWRIFEYQPFIPQMPNRHHESRKDRLQIRDKFETVINYYKKGDGLSQFYNDYLNEEIPTEINGKVISLMIRIRRSIWTFPMKHLGRSVYPGYYPIFKLITPSRIHVSHRKSISRELLVREFGKFSFPKEYFEVFNLLGGFIIGDRSIFNQWAELTEKFSDMDPSYSEIHDLLHQEPITERQVSKVRNFYLDLLAGKYKLKCTWSGKSIESPDQLDIDHLIPFSKWKNNDLWNLVPTLSSVNSNKRDRIPSRQLLERSRQRIYEHWQRIENDFPRQFTSEIKLSLVGYSEDYSNLNEAAFLSLLKTVDDLINSRKYPHWNG